MCPDSTFSEGFRLPYFVMLREVAPDGSHHLQDLYSARCYPLIIKYLSHFPRLSILEIHSRLVSIPSDLSVNSVALCTFKMITCTSCMSPYCSDIFAKATFVSNLILIQTCTVRSGYPWSAPFMVKKY